MAGRRAAVRIQKQYRGWQCRTGFDLLLQRRYQWQYSFKDQLFALLRFLCRKASSELDWLDYEAKRNGDSLDSLPKAYERCQQWRRLLQFIRYLKKDSRRKKAIMEVKGRLYSYNGETLLHYAALCWHPQVLQQLLIFGFEVNELDGEGQLPLHHCIGYPENARVLLQAGSAVNLPISGRIDMLYDGAYSRLTALHLAVASRNSATIALLLQYGAKVNAKDSAGRTPCNYLSGPGEKEAYDELLSRYANVSV